MKYIINIEGCDGIGKCAISTKLTSILSEKYSDVVYQSSPDYDTEIGRLLKLWLTGNLMGKPIETNPYAASMLFTLDRFNTMRKYEQINHDKECSIIVNDRSYMSNVFYQGVKLLPTLFYSNDPLNVNERELTLSERFAFSRFITHQYQAEIASTEFYKDSKILNIYLTYEDKNNIKAQLTNRGPAADSHENNWDYLLKTDRLAYLIERDRNTTKIAWDIDSYNDTDNPDNSAESISKSIMNSTYGLPNSRLLMVPTPYKINIINCYYAQADDEIEHCIIANTNMVIDLIKEKLKLQI